MTILASLPVGASPSASARRALGPPGPRL